MRRRQRISSARLRRFRVVLFVVPFVAIGALIVILSRAANSTATLQVGSGTVSGNATSVTDPEAVGGSYVQFGSTNPIGGGKPDATNTGYGPTGVTLAPVAGMTITTDGTVIDAKDISGAVIIKANNVTIKRSRIRSTGYMPIWVQSGHTNITITDNEVDGMMGASDGGTKCIVFDGGSGLIARNNIHHCEDGLSINGSGALTITQNYVHDLKVIFTGPHSDGIEYYSGSGRTISYNNIDNTGGTTSAINLTNDYGTISNSIIANNWLAGGSFTLYIDGSHGGGIITDITVRDNQFKPNSATYGTHLVRGNLGTINWTGNVFEGTNQPIPL